MELSARARKALKRSDNRVCIHFDYDCFYASVVEVQNPALKGVPLAIQQKQIVVTCNYAAREKGVYKLQLLESAKKICPELVVVLGEDISRFRDASKDLYNFLRSFSWNGKVERLGFDEVWLDVTDIVDYNVVLLNHNDLQNTFFCLSRDDPTVGFLCDVSQIAGHVWGDQAKMETAVELAAHNSLRLRLALGSHLAQYLRRQLEEQKGYTATVGVSTNKMLSKLVGNVNKPRAHTTLVPPYITADGAPSNVTSFIDSHEVGRIPGIGFKMAQKLREHYLQRPTQVQESLVTFNIKDNVTVLQLRTMSEMGPLFLEKLLGGPGWPADIGYKAWALMHGVDDTEVAQAREIPKQISLEDSYIRLDTYEEAVKELKILSRSLIKRMRVDLTEEDDATSSTNRHWLAHPRTIRLSTRPRSAQAPITSSRARIFQRISRSAPLPNFIFGLSDSIDAIAERLVEDTLLPLFRKLHPEKQGWNLSLVNIAVTNMVETAGDNKSASGRNIGSMFRKQEDTLREWKVEDRDVPPEESDSPMTDLSPSKDHDGWLSDEELDAEEELVSCPTCGGQMPPFAIAAHLRFHENGG